MPQYLPATLGPASIHGQEGIHMTLKLVRLLAVLGMAAALVAVPAAAQAADAGTPTGSRTAKTGASTQASAAYALLYVNGVPIHCTVPFVSVPYVGDVAQCTQISGILGRPGLLTGGQFSASSPYFQVANANWFSGYICADDGGCGSVGGFGVLATPYGATVFATQYSGEYGRWGNWNLHTNKFYPGSGWFRVAP
jgi:hypothetical protein